MINLGTSVIVENAAGEVLFIKREDFRLWVFPGGSLDHGETFVEGARREVKEETGVDIEIDGVLGVFAIRRGQHYSLVFHGHPLNDHRQTSFESLAVEYFPSSGLPSPVPPMILRRLDIYLNGERNVLDAAGWPFKYRIMLPPLIKLRNLRNRYLLKRPTPVQAQFTGMAAAYLNNELIAELPLEPDLVAWQALKAKLTDKLDVDVCPRKLRIATIDVDNRHVQFDIDFELG